MWTCLTQKGNSSILRLCSFPGELQEHGLGGGDPGPAETLSFAVALLTSLHTEAPLENSPQNQKGTRYLFILFLIKKKVLILT